MNLPGICFAGATNAPRKSGIPHLFGKISKMLFFSDAFVRHPTNIKGKQAWIPIDSALEDGPSSNNPIYVFVLTLYRKRVLSTRTF